MSKIKKAVKIAAAVGETIVTVAKTISDIKEISKNQSGQKKS